MLAEAEIDPAGLSFTLSYGVEGDNERVVTVLQSMWQENLGIAVTLEPLELATFSSRLNDTYQDPANGLQAYYSVWGADYPDPQNFLSLQLQTDVGNNNGHWSNAEFDALTQEADTTVDDFARRAALYNQAEQIAVTEVGWLPLFNAKVNGKSAAEQVDRALFEYTGTNAAQDIFSTLSLDDDSVDSCLLQQPSQREACRSGADNRNLSMHECPPTRRGAWAAFSGKHGQIMTFCQWTGATLSWIIPT